MPKPTHTKPKNWPPELPYLTTPKYSKNLTSAQLATLRANSSTTTAAITTLIPGPSPLVKITPITSPTHPANTQSGLFATHHLPPSALILHYIGELHSSFSPTDVAQHANSAYDIWLDHGAGVAVDAASCGNEARFVNDYRGISTGPNAEFREVWDQRKGEWGVGVFVLPARKVKVRGKGGKGGNVGGKGKGKGQGELGKGGKEGKRKGGIRKGEEILVSYGKGFWGGRGARHEEEEEEWEVGGEAQDEDEGEGSGS